MILAATLAVAQDKDGSVVSLGLAERKLAGVDVRSGHYTKPAQMHANAMMMENDANGSGGGDESLEWDTPKCHVRVLSRYAQPDGARTTYSATVTRPEDQPQVSEPAEGSCATGKGVAMGDPAWKAVVEYGSRVRVGPGKKKGNTILHWEWKDGTVLEITVDAQSMIVGLDLTGNVT